MKHCGMPPPERQSAERSRLIEPTIEMGTDFVQRRLVASLASLHFTLLLEIIDVSPSLRARLPALDELGPLSARPGSFASDLPVPYP
jgi:hypothetical protein